jgi:2,4-dichlorophenol 6-monooxygenase
VAPDPLPDAGFARDRELYYQPTTRSGAHLPHAWIYRAGLPVSTLDVAGQGGFVLLTGIAGEAWAEAAAAVAAARGLPLGAVVIGPGREYEDPFGEWALAREVAEGGAVLVRPDMIVGWRALTAPEDGRDAERLLERALAQILAA